MKFLFITSDYIQGGITSSLKNLTDLLITRGHEVSLLDLTNENLQSVHFNIKIKHISISGLSKYWNISKENYHKAKCFYKIILFIVGGIKKILNKLNLWEYFVFFNLSTIECDVAIAYRQSSILYYLIKHKTTAKKTIAFIHSEFFGDCSSWISKLIEIDAIACVSNAWRDDFKNKFPLLANKTFTVYNVFNSITIKKMAETFIPNYNNKKFNIVTVSRLEDTQKKISQIPRICKKLLEQNNEQFHWYIIGEGPSRQNVELAIKETNTSNYITLLGSKENPYPYIKNANLFVLNSEWESYGMVLMEALILGVPVVTTNYLAAYEIVKNNINGIIADNNTNAMADAIKLIINNPQIYINLKDACQKYNYSPELALHQLYNICK